MKTAKVFKSGNSQAVRIPKKFQFNQTEIEIRKRGDVLILRPKAKSWATLVESLKKFTDDFMEDGEAGRKQPRVQDRGRVFP